MSSLQEYFRTDWDAMTASDWVGMTTTVVIFVLMAGVYIWVFLPRNHAGFERHRDLAVRDGEKLRGSIKDE